MKEKIFILIMIVVFAFLDYTTHYKPELRNAPSVSDSYIGYTYSSSWDRSNHKTYPKTLEDMYTGARASKQVK